MFYTGEKEGEKPVQEIYKMSQERLVRIEIKKILKPKKSKLKPQYCHWWGYVGRNKGAKWKHPRA